MKKIFGLLIALLVIYGLSLLWRASALEQQAANAASRLILKVAQPWDAAALRSVGSVWLREVSRLTPEKIVELARQDFGDLQEIRNQPECSVQKGIEKSTSAEHIYAICDLNLRMEKKQIRLKLRLINQTGPAGKISNDWLINDFMSISSVF